MFEAFTVSNSVRIATAIQNVMAEIYWRTVNIKGQICPSSLIKSVIRI